MADEEILDSLPRERPPLDRSSPLEASHERPSPQGACAPLTRPAKEALREAREELERRVEERTVELARANAALEREIDERKQVEDQIRRLNQELEHRSAELEAFAYSVSHDLRAPLRHMEGFANLLRKGVYDVLDDKSRHYLDTISQAARRMSALIDELLTFSRIGRMEVRCIAVPLDPLIREVLAELQEETTGRDIAWKIDPLPSVQGEPELLHLVWMNLLSNALKFSQPRAQARIEIGSLPGEPGEVVLFVRDNGVGFDMRYVGKLFGVFQRLHPVSQFEGTGIGLANVQRIIHRHGGRVWAEGDPGKGATFYFSLTRSEGGIQ